MRIFIALSLLSLAATGKVAAHESRPLFVEMKEVSGSRIEIDWTAPGTVDLSNAPRLALAAPCVERAVLGEDMRSGKMIYDCAISDAVLQIEWPVFNPSISTLIRMSYANGETRSAILDPSETEWRAPAPENFTGVSQSYFTLGVSHIFGGVDHLLFLAGLLIIAGTPRRVLVTVTGFTLAHSLTLALVALGLLRVSVPATEAVIALSIVFLATEIARGDKTTLTWRRPVLVASAFGLAHGAGFAAALGEIGLPQTEKIAALLFFNLGVEAGQIGAIFAAFAAFSLARRAVSAAALTPDMKKVERIAAYALGILAGFWFMERLAALAA